jgi:glycosyltransferase involved in cell wall biosynthesis
MAPPTLLFLVSEDFYFWSHRLPLARGARDAGYRVLVATRVAEHGERIRGEGFGVLPLRHLRRGAGGPAGEARTIAELTALYREHRPDITHHVAVKPVLYGSIAARLAGVPCTVNAFAGLGWAFTQTGRKAAVIEPVFSAAYRAALGRPGSVVLFQNTDDRDTLVRAGAVRADATAVIRGSGIDLARYRPADPPDGPVAIVLGARMLKDKGVGELVAAARLLRARGLDVVVRLFGEPDPENPSSFSRAELEAWRDEGVVEWRGATADMAGELARAHVACLPSYREGLPKFLLEAAATGLPIVTADVPGCREAVRHEYNGLLVPVRTVEPLAEALERLVRDPALRARMGAAGRQRAEQEFAAERVVAETLGLYERLRSSRARA